MCERLNGYEIEITIEAIRGNKRSNFKKSLVNFFDEKGFITEKQYNSLKLTKNEKQYVLERTNDIYDIMMAISSAAHEDDLKMVDFLLNRFVELTSLYNAKEVAEIVDELMYRTEEGNLLNDKQLAILKSYLVEEIAVEEHKENNIEAVNYSEIRVVDETNNLITKENKKEFKYVDLLSPLYVDLFKDDIHIKDFLKGNTMEESANKIAKYYNKKLESYGLDRTTYGNFGLGYFFIKLSDGIIIRIFDNKEEYKKKVLI